MPNSHDPFDRIAKLHEAEIGLTQAIIENAEVASEEKFFQNIQKDMDDICAAIAEVVDVDTCAFFWVNEDIATKSERRIVMCAASGNFVKVLQLGRKGIEEKGYAYSSRLHEIKPDMPEERQEEVIREWPITNQIWHLGDGRLANSNCAMNFLARSHIGRMGQGDVLSYSNLGTLRSAFRNMVGIPIFARGTTITVSEENHKNTPTYQDRAEFLSRYRVTGILKVENKKPQRNAMVPSTEDALIKGCPESAKELLRQWFEKGRTIKNIEELFYKNLDDIDDDGFDLLNYIPEGAHSKSIEEKKKLGAHPDIVIIDYLTEVFDAQFTQEDAELLVSLAMQLGRVLARRTIEHAARHNIVISEHESGTLNVRYSDIEQLEVLFGACDCLRREVEHSFQLLDTELTYAQQRRIHRAQVSHRIEPREPIRQVTSRLKHPISLFRKLVERQEELERQLKVKHLTLHRVGFDLDNFGSLTEQQALVNGHAQLFWVDPPHGSAQADLHVELGIKGGPQAIANEHDLDATLKDIIRPAHLDHPLVWRILNLYGVDDIAGVRIICDYLSDLVYVLEYMHARASEWGVSITKIDEATEAPKEGGYRGIHVTLLADVEHLIPCENLNRLEEAFGIEANKPLKIPCEVQLRTTLQQSEALKSWGETYKHGDSINEKSLLELLQIHCNQLYEADKSRDIIRDRIESLLLPDDFGERSLLNYLRPRLTPEGLTLVELGLQCAKHIHRNDLRLNGLPYISYLLATCERLIYNFSVTDPNMLFLALLHDLWMNPCDVVEDRLLSDKRQYYDQESFQQDLNDTIQLENILQSFGGRINWRKQLEKFSNWFWVLLDSFRQFWRDCHEERPEDTAEQQRRRLWQLRDELKREHGRRGGGAILNDWLQRAFVLEAAILLSQLEELPDEQNQQHAEELFRNAYEELEIIISNLPPSPTKQTIVEETTNVFRKTAERLKVEVPINWYR